MVQQSVCAPSRTSFLTGRRPDTTRLYDFGSYWREHAGNYTTIPQHFKENGYITLSVGKVFHPGKPSGSTDDFPYSWTLPAYQQSTQSYSDSKVCPGNDGNLYNNVMCPIDVDKMPDKTLPDLQTLETAENLIKILSPKQKHDVTKRDDAFHPELEDALHGGEGRGKRAPVVRLPFFLAVGFRKPHIPWKYPKEYKGLYPLDSVEIAPDPNIPDELPNVAQVVFRQLRLRDDIKAMNLSFPIGTIPLKYHASLRQSYYAATTYTDYLVGRLLQALEDGGYSDNTIISLVGDHGWQLGDHGEWCKYSNYQLATRAPLMVHVPGVTDQKSSTTRKFPLIDPLSPSFQGHLKEDGINEVDSRVDEIFSTLQSHQSKNQIDSRVDDSYLRFPHDQTDNEVVESRKSPGLKTKGRKAQSENVYQINEFVELVDLFPTLAELTGLPVPPVCPPNPFNVTFCSEGYSFAPLIQGEECLNSSARRGDCRGAAPGAIVRWKNATFSQYPRPSVTPDKNTDLPSLDLITIMGYSMRTDRYHYTEWIGFNHTTFQGDWSDVKARELYLNDSDPRQDNNVANEECYRSLVGNLSHQLQRGWRDSLPVFKTRT
ncbi:iduronate 2-sulfatase-like isoform X2 [Strongylocentrotus purpuratus]|nr:iduronate 2-sulfatase-like isoform X2 [Strongylocentrotus purpuratus]